MSEQPEYELRLRALPHPDRPEQRLKWILKKLLRAHAFRCISAREISEQQKRKTKGIRMTKPEMHKAKLLVRAISSYVAATEKYDSDPKECAIAAVRAEGVPEAEARAVVTQALSMRDDELMALHAHLIEQAEAYAQQGDALRRVSTLLHALGARPGENYQHLCARRAAEGNPLSADERRQWDTAVAAIER